MKAAEIDIIDSLCKRQTLIEIINYSGEEIKRKNSVNYWFDHYIDKKLFDTVKTTDALFDKNNEYYQLMLTCWNNWIKFWEDKRDNYIQKSVMVNWFQDKNYLETGKE